MENSITRTRPLKKWKLFLYVLPLITGVLFLFHYLPFSLVELVVAALLIIPVAFYMIDKPRLVFYVLIVIIFSNIDVFAPFRIYRYFLVFFLASFMLAWARGKKPVLHDRVYAFIVAAFIVAAFQSIVAAADIGSSLHRMGLFLKAVLVLAITIQFVKDRRDFRNLLFVVALGIALSDFLPFVIKPPTRFASLSMVWSEGVFRYEGFVFEPNTFAMFQIFFIPILLFVFAYFKKRTLVRIVVVAALVASVFTLIMSFSRGGFVSLAFLVVAFIVIERRNKAILLTGLSFVVLGIILAPPVYWERIGSILTFSSNMQQDFAIVSRLQTMGVALKLGMQHLFFGVGIENFLRSSVHYIPYTVVVHNAFLLLFAELGLPGLVTFSALIVYNLVLIGKLMSAPGDDEANLVGRILLVQNLAIVVNSMFIPVSYEMITWFAFLLPSLAYYAYLGESVGRKKSLLL